MSLQLVFRPAFLFLAAALIIVLLVFPSLSDALSNPGAVGVSDGSNLIYGRATLRAEARLGTNIVIDGIETSVNQRLFSALRTFTFFNPVEGLKCFSTFIDGRTNQRISGNEVVFGDVGARFGEDKFFYNFAFRGVPTGTHTIEVKCTSNDPTDTDTKTVAVTV